MGPHAPPSPTPANPCISALRAGIPHQPRQSPLPPHHVRASKALPTRIIPQSTVVFGKVTSEVPQDVVQTCQQRPLTTLAGGGGGDELERLTTIGGPPPPPPKMTIVGKNGIYNWEKLIGPFLEHNFLDPPPRAQKTPCPRPPRFQYIFLGGVELLLFKLLRREVVRSSAGAGVVYPPFLGVIHVAYPKA